ncbi:MAG: hypothetical protein K0S07_272 [Chlamydiales bacterium]|jgi:hypothetical protein|nr:hypothetical protein [Chlamydiales bacterium]
MTKEIPLSVAAQSIRAGIYRHYKGQFYQVLSAGRHSENLEEYVIYQAL